MHRTKKTVRRSPAPAESDNNHAGNIVLILDDVGFENQPLKAAASIDASLNFAVIPGSPKAMESAEMLSSRGFEILCHLPMEPLDDSSHSPGQGAILVSQLEDEIKRRTRDGIRAIPHAKGVNNHMGSRATRDRRVMASVAEVLKDEGVYFIDSRTVGSSVAAQVVGEHDVPVAARDVFLDDDRSDDAVRRQLRELVRIARRNDYAVGIGHVYPSTVRVLSEEIPKLRENGITFVFASSVLKPIDRPVESAGAAGVANSSSAELVP